MTGGFDFNGNGKIDAMDHAIGYSICNDTSNNSVGTNSTNNTHKSNSKKESFSWGPVLLFMAVLSIFVPELEAILLFILLGIGFVKLLIG